MVRRFFSDSTWFTGDYEAGFRGWFEETPKAQHKQIMERMAGRNAAGASLTYHGIYNESNIDLPFTFAQKYSAKDYLVPAGEYFLLRVPSLNYDFPEIALKERNYDIQLDMSYRRHHDITFTLENGLEAVFIPDSVYISNPYFEYRATYTKKGNKIHFADYYDIKKMRVPKEDYQMYKNDALKVMAFAKEQVFIRKEGAR
jgi:hypothetical protein